MTPASLKAYIRRAFHRRFPEAHVLLVAFLDLPESWVVVVDDQIYSMFVGSDDDEFSFKCETSKRRARVTFPLPQEMQP